MPHRHAYAPPPLLLRAPMQELQAAVFGNPHSSNPSSLRTEARVEELRRRVLDFFGADPSIYDVRRAGEGGVHPRWSVVGAAGRA